MKTRTIAKKMLLMSNPVLWFYNGGLFIFGALVGFYSNSEVATIAALLPQLTLYFAWFLIMENVFIVPINDYYDRDIDKLNPRKIAYEAMYEDRFFLLYVILIFLSPLSFFLIEHILPNLYVFVYGLLLFAGNMLYNIPPIRVKERFILDVLIGPVCYLAPLFSGYSLVTREWPSGWAIITGICVFGAFELLHKTFDIVADGEARVRTTATILGFRASLISCAVLLVSGVIALYVGTQSLVFASLTIPYLFLVWRTSRLRSEVERLSFYGTLRYWYISLGFLANACLLFS